MRGRQRINIHGALGLATGQTQMIEVATVDARGSIIASAAFRSAWPSAFVRQASPTRPLRFSIKGMAHMAEPGFLAFALAVEACVGIDNGPMGFVRALLAMEVHLGVAAFAGGFWPVPPEPASPAGGSAPLASALGWRLFIEAQASISVPSTQKCSSDNGGSTALSAGRQRTGAVVFVGARPGRVSLRDPAGGIAQ